MQLSYPQNVRVLPLLRHILLLLKIQVLVHMGDGFIPTSRRRQDEKSSFITHQHQHTHKKSPPAFKESKRKAKLFTKLRLLPPFNTTGVPSHRNLLLLFIHNAAVARRRQKIAAISNFWTGGTNRPGRRVNS